ncbi:MAG: hypothetical protein KAI17_16660, partial [Thiotrichaceae bacterium]|nr:hypothetical protein [Thiotrichaceae bacterium]
SGILNKSGFYILYEYIELIEPQKNYIPLKPNKDSLAYVNKVMSIIVQMHNSNTQPLDFQFSHFLLQDEQIIIIDCGAIIALEISSNAVNNEIRFAQIHQNMADIFSQLPISYDQYIDDFLKSYQLGVLLSKKLSTLIICQAMKQCRLSRLEKYPDKLSIDNNEFFYEQNKHQTLLCEKQYCSEKWLSFYQQLNELVESTPRLEESQTATMVLAQCDDKKVVIKRYNTGLKNRQLSTKGWNSWQKAHQLAVLGIKAPRPIAIIEQNIGWLQNQVFYLSEYDASEDALSYYSQRSEISEIHLEDFKQLFRAMIDSQVSHGDLKASNILLTQDGLSLSDLDSIQFHSPSVAKAKSFKNFFAKDLQNFMNNWPLNSTMYQQFQQLLKELPDKPPC